MKIRLLPFAILITPLYAEEALNLASATEHKMLLNFGPPPIITPQTEFTMPLENQFDYVRPWRDPNVALDVAENTTRPLQLESLISGQGHSERGLFRYRSSNAYAVAQGYHLHLHNYDDALGNPVNAGYERAGQTFAFGFVPDDRQEYRIGFVHDAIYDDKQPHNPMDPVETRRRIFTGTVRLGEHDQSNTFNFSARHIHLDRFANNHQLRTPANRQPRVAMRLERQMSDAEADYRLQYGAHRSQFGIKYGVDEHLGERFVVTPQGQARNAFRFPDVKSERLHVFYDHFWDVSEQHRLSGGISYDRLSADARARNTPSAAGTQNFPAPNRLWQNYYGKRLDDKAKTDGFGASLSYEYRPTEQQRYRITADSLIRQPGNEERFSALPGQNGTGWIGNPFLDPERHNRLSIAADWQGAGWRDYGKIHNGDIGGAWQIGAQIDYDKVSDFITLDRARGQNGIRQTDGNVIARNVDATLIGAQVHAAKSLSANVAARGKIRYQRGENDSDNRPLYNIRPLTADLAVDWHDYASFGSYNIGANLHYAHKNTRLDSNRANGLGYDNPLHHQSYATVNLYGSLQTSDRFALSLGVNNLFNRHYHAYNEHSHVDAISPAAVAAPERTYWLGFNFNF